LTVQISVDTFHASHQNTILRVYDRQWPSNSLVHSLFLKYAQEEHQGLDYHYHLKAISSFPFPDQSSLSIGPLVRHLLLMRWSHTTYFFLL